MLRGEKAKEAVRMLNVLNPSLEPMMNWCIDELIDKLKVGCERVAASQEADMLPPVMFAYLVRVDALHKPGISPQDITLSMADLRVVLSIEDEDERARLVFGLAHSMCTECCAIPLAVGVATENWVDGEGGRGEVFIVSASSLFGRRAVAAAQFYRKDLSADGNITSCGEWITAEEGEITNAGIPDVFYCGVRRWFSLYTGLDTKEDGSDE